MFKGDYNFFDYKYNITGYTGQDYGGMAQNVYLIVSAILMILLLIVLRKSSKKKVLNIIRVLGIFLICFYIGKTTWESIYDIRLSGGFNKGLLPLDTCSLIMLATILAGFAKGKVKEYAESWLVTGSILGGFGTMLFLNAFKYYPFWSFGAFYSMIWHFLMVFIGLLIIVTNYIDFNYKVVLKGFVFHLLFSIIVIPIDYIYNFDFMMYKDLGSIPIFEGVASEFTKMHIGFLNPFMMLLLYFIAFNIIYFIYLIINKILNKHKK